jgi:hypothetical protein
LGPDESKSLEYGLAPNSADRFSRLLQRAVQTFGQRRLAERMAITRKTLARLLQGHLSPRMKSRCGYFLKVIAELECEITQ